MNACIIRLRLCYLPLLLTPNPYTYGQLDQRKSIILVKSSSWTQVSFFRGRSKSSEDMTTLTLHSGVPEEERTVREAAMMDAWSIVFYPIDFKR